MAHKQGLEIVFGKARNVLFTIPKAAQCESEISHQGEAVGSGNNEFARWPHERTQPLEHQARTTQVFDQVSTKHDVKRSSQSQIFQMLGVTRQNIFYLELRPEELDRGSVEINSYDLPANGHEMCVQDTVGGKGFQLFGR
jgi:hypothetical protein